MLALSDHNLPIRSLAAKYVFLNNNTPGSKLGVGLGVECTGNTVKKLSDAAVRAHLSAGNPVPGVSGVESCWKSMLRSTAGSSIKLEC